MIDWTKKEEVAALQANCHAVFDTPQGQEVMKFLEISCGWYQSILVPGQHDLTLINDGKRQVVATLKTLLELSPEQIAMMARQGRNAL